MTDEARERLEFFSTVQTAIASALGGDADGCRDWVDRTSVRAGLNPPSYQGGDPCSYLSDDSAVQAEIDKVNRQAAEHWRSRGKDG